MFSVCHFFIATACSEYNGMNLTRKMLATCPEAAATMQDGVDLFVLDEHCCDLGVCETLL